MSRLAGGGAIAEPGLKSTPRLLLTAPVPVSRPFICPDCDLVQRVPPVPPGAAASCRRCGAKLRSAWPRQLDFALVASIAGLLLMLMASTTTLAVVERAGQRRMAGLLSGPLALNNYGLWELALLVGFVILVAPFVTTILLLVTLSAIRADWRPGWLALAFAWYCRLRPWSMIEVFLIGYFVAYSKLGAIMHIDSGPAFFALLAFMVTTIATDAVLDRQTVWEAIAPDIRSDTSPAALSCGLCHLPSAPAAHCSRCGSRLHRRKPNSLARTAALAASALILYVPANVFPVLTVEQLGRGSPSTILESVWELIGSGDYPLAIIVFLASVTVPVLKIIGLGVMLAFAVGLVPRHAPVHLTQLYRIVAAIGRWSMVDIFMEAILSSLVKFGAVATVNPGPGAIAFAAVVVLTIFAAESFDPRLMWDRTQA